jgi:hypothetical protein
VQFSRVLLKFLHLLSGSVNTTVFFSFSVYTIFNTLQDPERYVHKLEQLELFFELTGYVPEAAPPAGPQKSSLSTSE